MILLLLNVSAYAAPIVGGGLALVAGPNLGAGPGPRLQAGWAFSEDLRLVGELGGFATFDSGEIVAEPYEEPVAWKATEKMIGGAVVAEYLLFEPDQPLRALVGGGFCLGGVMTSVTPSVGGVELGTTTDGTFAWGAQARVGLAGGVGPGELSGYLDIGGLHLNSPLTGVAMPIFITPTLSYRVSL